MKQITYLLLSLLPLTSHAKVTLPTVLADGMVLQQKSEVKLWGWSNRQTVQIIPSWNQTTYTATVKSDGSWEISIQTDEAGGPYTIQLTDGDPLVLSDVYLGEVWLCSGQSNMEIPLKGYYSQPIAKSLETIARAKKEIPIRLYHVDHNATKTLQDDCPGRWMKNEPKSVESFSATAYFFGKELQQILNVPVGLIHTSWGGSNQEAWMPEEALKLYPSVSLDHLKDNKKLMSPNRAGAVLYNGMLYPLRNMTYRGMIWYQGESNRYDAKTFERLFPHFVKECRRTLDNEKLPIHYVQIAPFRYTHKDSLESAFVREAQMRCETLIPNAYMITTMDIGSEKCIHPSDKETVGKRLVYSALQHTYKIDGIQADAPRFIKQDIQGENIMLSFENVPMGLTSYTAPLKQFEIAGEDGVYYPAEASIVGAKKVKVWSEQVKKPKTVRYAFKNFVVGDLFGNNGLPVSSFRTDNL